MDLKINVYFIINRLYYFGGIFLYHEGVMLSMHTTRKLGEPNQDSDNNAND